MRSVKLVDCVVKMNVIQFVELVVGHAFHRVWFSIKYVVVKASLQYCNTIAGSSPGERMFIYFEKIRFAFLAKKISKNDLKWSRNNKNLQKLIYSILVFCLYNFLVCTFFIFRIIYGQPAMVLRYVSMCGRLNWSHTWLTTHPPY